MSYNDAAQSSNGMELLDTPTPGHDGVVYKKEFEIRLNKFRDDFISPVFTEINNTLNDLDKNVAVLKEKIDSLAKQFDTFKEDINDIKTTLSKMPSNDYLQLTIKNSINDNPRLKKIDDLPDTNAMQVAISKELDSRFTKKWTLIGIIIAVITAIASPIVQWVFDKLVSH